MRFSAIFLIAAGALALCGCRHYDTAPPPYYYPPGCGCARPRNAHRRTIRARIRVRRTRARIYRLQRPRGQSRRASIRKSRRRRQAAILPTAILPTSIPVRFPIPMRRLAPLGDIASGHQKNGPFAGRACEGPGRFSHGCTPRREGCGTPFTCSECRRGQRPSPTTSAAAVVAQARTLGVSCQ